MSGTWERVRNSFGSTNPDSIDQFSESSQEFSVLECPETPDSIHPPGLELIENMKFVEGIRNFEKAENERIYQHLRINSQKNDQIQALKEENENLKSKNEKLRDSSSMGIKKAKEETANINKMYLAASLDAQFWKKDAACEREKNEQLSQENRTLKFQLKSLELYAKNLEFLLERKKSSKDQESQTALEMVSSPNLSVPENEESEDSDFDYSEEVLESLLESEDAETYEMNAQRMECSSEFDIPPGFLAAEECPELEISEKTDVVLVPETPKSGKSDSWKTIENGKVVECKEINFEKVKKSRAPRKRTPKASIVEVTPLIEESQSESEDSLEVFEICKIPKTAKNAKKAAKKFARLERIQLEEVTIPEVQEAPAGRRQLEELKNLVNTKNQEIRKLRREIEKSQMVQCMDLLRMEYWEDKADTADTYFKILWSTISRIRLNINVPLAKPEDFD
ncbi:unnamed protein product [Caenorhabditis nigoni]